MIASTDMPARLAIAMRFARSGLVVEVCHDDVRAVTRDDDGVHFVACTEAGEHLVCSVPWSPSRPIGQYRAPRGLA